MDGDPAAAARAVADEDPLPGGSGFAGQLADGRLARDVLGRWPLYVDGDDWAHDPTALADPEPFPAGHAGGPQAPERRWSLPDPAPVADRDRGVAAVGEAVETALDGLDPTVPVAFSGGVDSALVASATEGPLYAVGFPGSHDLEAAREAAAAMGRADDMRTVELDLSTLEAAVPRVARAVGRTNAMDVAIALPLFLAARRAAADGHDCLAVGQGADELFGGYAKVAGAPEDPRVDAETVRGARREVAASLPDQVPRDVLALRAGGVEPVAPFLRDAVVRAALALPGDLLADGDRRKVALRAVARDRLPAALADRDKKAMQYGTLVSRELDRLARRAGFKRRQADHVSRYVAHRLADG